MQSSALGSASASSRSPTMQPPRDDPGAPTSNGAVEVPHETVLKLRSLTTTIQCLLHTLTGECVTLPTSEQPWQLSFAKGFGYIWSAGGQKPMWCKSLLSHTAWKKGETVCIAHRPAATADAQEHTPHKVWWWLSEWKNEGQPYWVKWRACMDPVVCELPALKVMCFHAPKSDFRCFWDISGFQSVAGVSKAAKWLSNGMQRWKPILARRFGFNDGYFNDRQLHNSHDRRHSSVTPTASTPALLALLVQWAGTCRNSVLPQRPLHLVRGMAVHVAVGGYRFTVDPDNRNHDVRSPHGTPVTMNGCKLHVGGNVPHVGAGESLDIADVLSSVYSEPRLDWFMTQLLIGISHSIEHAIVLGSWPTSPLEHMSEIMTKRKRCQPVDPDVMHALSSADGTGSARTLQQATRVARSVGLQLPTHLAAYDTAQQLRYWLAARRCNDSSSISLCMSVDAKRFGGKHFLAGALFNVDVNKACWCNPVVSHAR